MKPHTENLLRQIGSELDQGIFPNVHDGGLVWPARAAVIFPLSAKEQQHEKRQPASPNPSGQTGESGTSTPGASNYSWATSAAASIPLNLLGLSELVGSVTSSYPGTDVKESMDAVWLRVPASILPDLGYRAVFVVALAPSAGVARGWGFWDGGVAGLRPIGPRHTNYGDASICAFDHREGTWRFGDSLVSLLDLYSVWAARQLYAERFGQWPGPQGSFSPFERLREYQDCEWCGCEAPNGRYVDCCKNTDRALMDRGGRAYFEYALLPRAVPRSISAFAHGGQHPRARFDDYGTCFS